MIKVDDISFSYHQTPLFEKASFTIGNKQKVAIVGANGAGKSTLFKLILGQEMASTGKIKVLGDIGYVPQEVKRDKALEESATIREYLDPENKVEESDIMKLLAGLRVKKIDLEKKPQKLSGGQKTKLALARALLMQPEMLLLDEPTNFMDAAGKQFVMDFLATYPHSLLIISHDLDLLDEHIDKVLEVDKPTKQIIQYKGNYTEYKRLKKEREEHLRREILVKQKHIKQMEESLKKLYKQKSAKGVRQRVVHQRRLEREKAALPEMPKELKAIKLSLPEPPRVAELPLQMKNVAKSFGQKEVLNDISFAIRRGEKFMLIGPNGSGKSTIIKILMKQLKPDNGYVVEGENLKVGYYSQEFDNFDMEAKLIDVASEKGKLYEQQARSFLARFHFNSEKINQKIASLSGGEKTRLSIALLMLENNNMLILDEPTTYLDPMSQRIILEAIKEYKGTLLLVSHVEDFVKEIAPDRALIMPDASLKLWSDDLLELVAEI